MADYSSPPLQDGGELGQMASTTSASGRLLQSDCNVPDSLVSAASPSGHLLQMECKGPDPLVSAATHSGHILQTECRVADPLVSAATPSGHLLHMECDVPDPLVSATSPSGHLLQMECDVPDPLVSPTSPADHVLQTECKVPDPLVSAASPSGHLLQLECNVPDPLVSAASSSGHLLQMECDMPDPLVSAASPSAHLLQMECSVPDPVVSCHEFPNQGPALPKDLQEQGPVLPKDLGEQEEQTLPKGKPKHGPTLSLQTPVASAIHTMSLLQPDDLLVSEISSRLTTEVASFGLERTSVGEDAQATKSFPLDEALGKASDPLELHLPLTSDTSEKTFVGSELCKKILSSVTETSEVPGRSSAETDKSTDPIAATTEKLGSVVGATSHEKSIGIAGSELSVSVAKCVSVVSAQTDKPLVGAKSSEEYPSDSSLLSEQTPSNVVGQLQKSSAIDWVSTQPCLTLDTVEDSHLLKPFSLSEDELVSPLDSMKKSTSQPVASSDQSTLPPVSKDVISPLPSTKNSSSVITVDKKLPCSSSQSSENDKSTSVLPLQKDELPPGVSGSSGSQDIQECFQVRSKSHDNTCDTENGCELNLGADVSSEDKIVSEGLSCMNRMSEESEVVNSEQEMQADEPGECWNDVDSSREAAASGTLPLIVDTHTLSQADDEHSSVITNSVAHSNLISSSVLSSPQSGASNVDTVPLLETEPLQPVTIGSSLQPLEEVQEASVLDDPSFAADLALIDSSADEADSIGGLVINSVIGAADGVVDFHPDEEMETDRELTDISASAPQIVEGSCDNDSSDETGPSAKRMRFENGISDSEDKVQGTKKVIIKVTPVKNGHGLWDAHKLQEILLAKGTILLRLHASTDSYEMFEPDKDEKEVDFTGIIAEAKDEEHDHILGLANLEPDADVYDPLAIGATHASEHASPPHYNRPFPHSRGRSTALQPAMSRPGFRHLQSPPHPHYYMKHEVLGLPPPLEFEEPQLGTADWSGMDTPIVASPEPQDPPDPPTVETTSSPSPKPVLVRKRVKKPDRVIRLKKVCEQCGKAFNKSSKYLQHLRIHRPVQQCDKCSFKTKDVKRFRMHVISHKKANPEVRCNICSELFATDVTQRIHKKKIHNVHACKYCYTDYDSESKLVNHLKQEHGHIKEKKGYVEPGEDEYIKPINIFLDPPPTNEKRQFVCRLCNKETRNKYQLKIHIAQHLGVSSNKISDDFLLTQDIDNLIREGGLCPSISSQDVKLENLIPICSMEMSAIQKKLDASSEGNSIQSLKSASKKEISTLNSYHSMKRSVSSPSMPPVTKPFSDSYPGDTLLPDIKKEPKEESSNEQESDMDQEGSLHAEDCAVFRCGLCDLNFYTPNDLYHHAVNVHQNPKQSQSFKQVNIPKRMKPSIPCDLCDAMCKSTKALRAHHRVKHRKIFTCPACHVSHKCINKLLRHQKQIHKNKIRCRFQCSALFDTEAENIAHCKEVHKKVVKKLECPYCEVEYQYEGNLINHLEKCKNCPPERRPVHVCGNCDEILANIKKYNEHIKNCLLKRRDLNKWIKPEKETLPKNKGKSSSRGTVDYKECLDTNDNGKSKLSKKYKRSLEAEEQTDTVKSSKCKIGPQKCKYCPNKFADKDGAINHILAVHRNIITRMITEPQMCEVCGMIFKNPLCLCKHISKHYSDLGMWDVLVPPDILDVVKVRSYCWVCKSTLKGKMLHHTKMRNENIDKLLASEGLDLQETERFHCSKCDQLFPTRSGFWKHVKGHLSNLPKWLHQISGPSSSDNLSVKGTYECSECSLKFTNNSELYRHVAVHFLEPYSDDGYEIDNIRDEDGNIFERIDSGNEAADDEEEEEEGDNFDLEGFMNPDAKYKLCTAPNSMMSYELQNFLDSPTVEPVPFLGQNLQQPQERVKDALHMVKVVKVCEECGKTFERTSEYLQHINLHKLLQQCEKCNFKTKDKERFKLHMISHDSDNLKLRCNICHELFVSPISHRIHKRKIHSIFECKHCSADFMSDVKWKEHKKKGHKKMKFDITSEDKNENSNLVSLENPVHTFSDKMQLVCRLCNKETRNKYQLKIHVAQHLGVSSDKISDDDLIADIKPFSWEGGLLSPPEEPQEQNNQSVVTNKSMESVLQNLFPSENINVAAPQDEKSIDSSFFPSRIQFCDVRPKKEDTVSPESPRSTGNIKTDSLPSTLLPQPPGETGSVQTKISEESEHQCQDTPPAYRKRRVKSRRRFRPLIPCNHCSSAFTTNTALRNHKKRKHMKRPQCPACNMTKTSSRKLFQHQIKAHRNKFRCHFYCLALFDTREEQAAHHLAVHKRDDSKHICRYCKEEYPRGAYIKHLEECKEVPVNTESVSCNFCESSFCTDCEFTDHTKHCGPWKLKNKENNSDLDSPEKLSVQTSTKADTNTPSEIINQNVTQSHNKRKTRKNDYMNRKPKPKEREKIFKIPINKEEAQESQKKHLDASSHSVESMLESGGILQKCKFCPNTFDNSEDGISHVLSQHKTLLFATKAPQICHICNKSFISSLSYCKHIVKHYGELGLWDALVPSELDIENIRMNCWICKTAGMKYHRYHVTTRDKTIEKYLSSKACKMSSAKEGKIYHCSVCEESFPCRYSFWNHIKVHLSKSPFKNAEGGKYFKCVKCPMRFKKKSELLGHLGIHLLHSDTKEDEGELKTINKSKNFKRDLENKNAQDDTNEEHDKDEIENIWLEENVSDYKALPHRCKRCHKRFAKKEDALKHVVTTHKSLLKMMGETHVCHICDKTFMKPMVLCAHLLKHYSELNMWDDLVPKNLLEQTQDRRFCWICKNMLGRKASKHIHKRNNYIERVLSNKFKDLETDENFKCSLCNYACSNRYTYWKHIMLHMYKVPKKRKQKDVLAESPGNSNDVQKDLLECSECLCKFKEKSELNRHLASHFLLPFVQIDGKWKSDHSQSKDSLNSLSENHDNNKLQTVSAKYVEKKGKDKVEPQFISSIKKRTVAVRKSRPISNNDTLKCIRCFKTFENNEEAVKHVLSSHKFMLTRIVREPLTCTVCGAVFKSEWWLCRHISRHYSELGMWNALVPRDLLNKINLRNQCWICNCKLDKKYADHTSKRNIQIEKLLLTKCKKKEDIFNCSICNDTYRNRLEYWKHIKIHLCKPPVQYRSLNELLSTTCNSADDKEKVLECSDCSLSFNDEPELYAHLATHFLEHVSEQSNYNSESEQTEDEISETNFSDDEEWLPSSKTFERRKDRHNTREFISKREGESSLLAKKGCVNEVSSKDKDKNGLIDEDKNKVNDEAKSERNDEGNVNDKNESSWLEKVKPANSLGEDSDDELEETYEIGIDTDNDVGIGTDNEVGICTDNDFEIGTDNEFEIGTDDEFEIGTDNEFEIGTDDENENYTQY
nr:uncharacterized protein LOC128702436 [Cherax quadricarinatus]